MLLTVAVLCARMREDTSRDITSAIRDYVKNYDKGVGLSESLRALDARLRRLNGRPPPEEFCPSCYFQDGSQQRLGPVSDAGQEKFVAFASEKCGFEIQREITAWPGTAKA